MNAPHNSAQARAWRKRTAAVFAAIGALVFSSGIVMLTAPAASAAADKIDVCHRNSDAYVYLNISDNAFNNPQNGHSEHLAGGSGAIEGFPDFVAADAPEGVDFETWCLSLNDDGSDDGDDDGNPGGHDDRVALTTVNYTPIGGCGSTGAITPIGDTSDVDYSAPAWDGLTGVATVTATLRDPDDRLAWPLTGGWTASGPRATTATWTHDFGSAVPCPGQVSPENPTVTQPACTGPGTSSNLSVELPANTDDISYDYSQHVVTATVTDATKVFAATLPANWVRVGDKTATYLVNENSAGACLVEVEAQAPSASENTCATAGTLVLPNAVDDGYSWTGSTSDAPGDHAVTAEADSGYLLTGRTEWTVHVNGAGEGLTGCTGPGDDANPNPGSPPLVIPNPELIPVTPNYAEATEGTCSQRGALIVPNQPDGVLTTRQGAVPGTVTFTYAAATGYTFPAGTITEQSVKVDKKLTGDECILGAEEVKPTHDSLPTQHAKPKPRDRGPVVLGTQAAVPTAVDAGLASLPTAVVSSTGSPWLAQALVAGGLLMLVAGGSMGLGRRTRGAYES